MYTILSHTILLAVIALSASCASEVEFVPKDNTKSARPGQADQSADAGGMASNDAITIETADPGNSATSTAPSDRTENTPSSGSEDQSPNEEAIASDRPSSSDSAQDSEITKPDSPLSKPTPFLEPGNFGQDGVISMGPYQSYSNEHGSNQGPDNKPGSKLEGFDTGKGKNNKAPIVFDQEQFMGACLNYWAQEGLEIEGQNAEMHHIQVKNKNNRIVFEDTAVTDQPTVVGVLIEGKNMNKSRIRLMNPNGRYCLAISAKNINRMAVYHHCQGSASVVLLKYQNNHGFATTAVCE